jgi:hypothetical protein
MYSTKDIKKITGIDEIQLTRLRNGYTQHGINGRVYSYNAILAEGIDYKWEKGRVVYFKSALKAINKRLKKANNG